MILSGHILETGIGNRLDQGKYDNHVFGLASNYQNLPEGGSGFLRILHFSNDGQKALVETYSPYLDSYKRDPGNHFIIDFSKGTFEFPEKTGETIPPINDPKPWP